MINYKEILRLNELGIKNSQIALSCSCSRTSVVNVIKKAKESDLSYETACKMSNKDISKILFKANSAKPSYKMPDYDFIHREMAKSGVTLSLLWMEYCDECRNSNEIPYKSTQFYNYYSDYVKNTKATMHIDRKPGEVLEVDWAGQTAKIINTDTGEMIKTYIFVAALPYSGYSYVEAFFSQNQENWISAHINTYKFFGGVTRILIPDNLKTGVEKVLKNNPVINKVYQEMAEHYGTAVIPAKVRTPKDKATVEGVVGIISTWILAAIRNEQFLSLKELNDSIKEKLYIFNNKPFQKKEGNRTKLFEEEKSFLIPLPENHFEMAIWKIATVQYNYHVIVDNQNYSVPYEYIKQKVDVRITKNVVEIFFEDARITSHPRLYGRIGQFSTIESHMPLNHQKYIQWNGEKFKNWASNIGENTFIVINSFLTFHKVEQQGYKSCLSLIKLADKYSFERLETACEKALSYTPSPSLKTIQAILKSGQDKVNITEETEKPIDSEH